MEDYEQPEYERDSDLIEDDYVQLVAIKEAFIASLKLAEQHMFDMEDLHGAQECFDIALSKSRDDLENEWLRSGYDHALPEWPMWEPKITTSPVKLRG